MPTSSARRVPRAVLAAVTLVTLALAVVRLGPPPPAAGAAVEHGRGYGGTVLGWTSWYGSYGLDGIGTGYCIDHGLRAPDAALGYAPTAVDDQAPATRAAMAWVVGAYGDGDDPDLAAAVMLVLHDLMGATYPGGRVDVDAMAPWQLAGFDGHEARVLDLARVMKADGLAHAALEAPLRLSIDPPPVLVGQPVDLVVRLTDAGGRAVSGIAVQLAAAGASVDPASAVTGADGTAHVTMTASPGDDTIVASAEPPDVALHAYASTSVPAQRAAVPARQHVEASTAFSAVPPGRLWVRKVGGPGRAPLAGADFTVHAVDGQPVVSFTTGAGGTAGPFDLAAGDYVLVEDAPPAGYELGGPWRVAVAPARDVTVEAVDLPTPPPPATTTTTTTTTTSTTLPATTTSTTTSTSTTPSTTVAATTTTALAATTLPATTSTSTTAPPASSAPATVLAEAPVSRALPRTGTDPLPLAATGAGLALVGTALVQAARHRRHG